MRTLHSLVALLALIGCSGGGPLGSGTEVRGRLIDDETGKPVARSTMYVHAFDDAAKLQVSLDPDDDEEFSLRMTGTSIDGRKIRLRIPDLSNTYELWEQTFEEQDGVLDVDVRLKPTHWVRLHGKVLWRDGEVLRPLGEEEQGNVRNAQVSAGRVGLRPDSAGNYSVNAPRELLKVLTINTNRNAHPKEIDLSGFKGDEFEQDVTLGE
ncbi:MAG: hypothetical protein K8T90_18430 [Planctomycetes bacterium]|nr:hypothetical protein [Planctomycetota bacterium]